MVYTQKFITDLFYSIIPHKYKWEMVEHHVGAHRTKKSWNPNRCMWTMRKKTHLNLFDDYYFKLYFCRCCCCALTVLMKKPKHNQNKADFFCLAKNRFQIKRYKLVLLSFGLIFFFLFWNLQEQKMAFLWITFFSRSRKHKFAINNVKPVAIPICECFGNRKWKTHKSIFVMH